MRLGGNLPIRMMKRALKKWHNFTVDERTVLAQGFKDAVRRPYMVADYQIELRRSRRFGEVAMHSFRIGYANFVLIATTTDVCVFDLWVDPVIGIAAE
jgi:hypothetical protein